MGRRTYQLNVAREGKWWIVDVPELDQLTQARTLAEVEEMGRDVIALVTDEDPDSFDLTVSIERPAEVTARLAEAERLERESRDSASRSARARRDAAHTLREAYGLSVIDTARLLGVTRARVYQLLNDQEKLSA